MNNNSKANNTGKKELKDGKGPQKPKIGGYWIYIFIALAFLSLNLFNFGTKPEEIDLVKLESLIKNREVSKLIVINRELVEVYLKKSANSSEEKTDNSNRGFSSLSQESPNICILHHFSRSVWTGHYSMAKGGWVGKLA